MRHQIVFKDRAIDATIALLVSFLDMYNSDIRTKRLHSRQLFTAIGICDRLESARLHQIRIEYTRDGQEWDSLDSSTQRCDNGIAGVLFDLDASLFSRLPVLGSKPEDILKPNKACSHAIGNARAHQHINIIRARRLDQF